MAPPADQGTGDREDNTWIQPADSVWVPEDDNAAFKDLYMIQPDTGLLNSDGNGSFDDIFDILMMQAPVGMDGNHRASSNHINNLVANGTDSRGHMYANIPRGSVAMEQIQPLLAPSFQTADSNIEPQHLLGNSIIAEEGQDEPEYVTDARTPHVAKNVRKSSGPSSEEWQRWEPEIRSLYFDDKYTLEVTKAKMAKKGFCAEAWMYKKKFRDWGWRTYERDKDSGRSGEKSSIIKPAKRTRGKASGTSSTKNSHPNGSRGTTVTASTPPYFARVHSQSTHPDSVLSKNTTFTPSHFHPAQFTSTHFNLSALREETLQSNSSHGTTIAVFTPPHSHHTRFNRTYSSMRIPAPISNTDFDKLMNTILANTKDLYISYPAQNKWTIKKQCEVEEDIHDDLLVGIAASVRNYNSLGPAVGYTGFQKALHMLEKVVGVGEGADCGLFSLPAIWVSFLRLVREQQSDWAQQFLSRASNLALNKFGREHSFAQVLLNLQKIWVNEPGWLEEVVLRTYRSCIANLEETLDSFNLTYLSLWADYVVYLDGTSINETNHVVKDIRGVIKVLEEEKEKGPHSGPHSDYILELLGLMIYVLQSAPTMADEAEKVTKELLLRVERRRMKAGGKLEGDLFTTWKDLREVLGTLCQDRKDYHHAISYLEEFLYLEIVDERDTLALEKLERCYLSVGRYEKAKEVWQRRMDESERLLRKTDTEPVRGEKFVNEHREIDNEEGEDVSKEERSSEGTVVDQVEEIDEENQEEYDANEIGDSEAEQQLLRDQMAELKKRLNGLETGNRNGGKIVT